MVEEISATGRTLFIYLLIYFFIHSSELFTAERNSSYCMSKAKSKYIMQICICSTQRRTQDSTEHLGRSFLQKLA